MEQKAQMKNNKTIHVKKKAKGYKNHRERSSNQSNAATSKESIVVVRLELRRFAFLAGGVSISASTGVDFCCIG
jgi:outer membrane scaffolding protein for murein synthesis (MipA/OmpV family)